MIYTSYFANARKFPIDIKKVSIAQFNPSWIQPDINAKELAPSKELLLNYKNNLIDEEGFRLVYLTQLSQLDPKEIEKKYDNCILLCYEKDGDFCHRSILREWLSSHNILSKEFI